MDLTTRRPWVVFIITCQLFVLSQFYRSSVAVISPWLIEELSLRASQLGAMSAAFFYSFSATQIPIGILLDRVGARRSMTILSLLAVAGSLIFAWSDSYPGLVAGRVLLGVGMACNLMGTLKLLTVWFPPDRFATLTTLVVSIGTAGNLLASTPLVLLSQAAGWRMTFVLFAAINLALTILFFFLVSDHPPGTKPDEAGYDGPSVRQILAGIGRLMSGRDYWIISLATFCRYGVFAAVQALWAGPFLMIGLKMDKVVAGNLLLVMNLALIVGGPVWGYISDKVLGRRREVVMIGLAGLALCLASLALQGKDANLLVLGSIFAGCGFFSSAGMIMYAHIKELVPLDKAGAAMTGINLFTMAGAAVFLQGLGRLMQHLFPQAAMEPKAFRTAFILCAACLGLIFFLYSRTGEPHRPPDPARTPSH